MNKDDAERIANARLAVYGNGPKLQAIQIKDPKLLGLGFVLDQGVPYKIVSKNNDTYTCRELTVQEREDFLQMFKPK